MTLTAQSIHAQQLQQEENTRKWLNDQVGAARNMLARANAALSDALATRKAAQAALDLALAQREAVLEKALPRMSLVRRLPLDVLSEIFAHVVDGYGPTPDEPIIEEDWPEDTFARALAPFQLAAVCQNWRRAALASSRLWTFVGISFEIWEAICAEENKAEMEAYEAYILLLLERSGQMPLEVQFLGVSSNWIDGWPSLAKLLVKLAARWRRVMLIMDAPDEDNTSTILGCFRSHMPLLEHLHIQLFCAIADIPDLTPVVEVPSAPRLSSIALVGVTLHATPGLTFTNLRNAAIMYASYVPADFWTVLRAMPHVRKLKLSTNFSTETIPYPTGSITFDRLSKLYIMEESCACGFTVGADVFRMPALRSLTLDCTQASELVNFIQRACKSATELTLKQQSEPLNEAVAQCLKHLPGLMKLSFESCTLPDAFFSILQDERACPALAELHIHNSGFVSETSSPLVRFVRARNVSHPALPTPQQAASASEAASAPASRSASNRPPGPLHVVTFDESEGPKGVSCWDAAEISRLVEEFANV